ncbi:hypothetical protein A4A49_20514 [Nicotiana attenuata]|uniref:Uncharacterized protein n=1 Tax=Nicotiana attenuata TaxID=49451 RepID=A0A1J6I245_NICAT|nr:hypothetical protein A4A49_20514 [Nicotiana attenuata]
MVLLDLIFHHGGEWVKKPLVAYSRKFLHTKKGFDSDLLSYNDLVDEYVSNLRGMSSINVPNIIHHNEHDEPDELEAATDCDESDNYDDNDHVVSSDYDSNRLEKLFTQKKRDINDKLTDCKELDRSTTFKDIAEARKVINMNSSGGKDEFKTLILHACEPAYENHRVNAKTVVAYFKRGLQDDPKIKVREMKASLKAAFNVNVSEAKYSPTEDDFHLSAPQPSQNSQSSNFAFMPTPTVQRQLPTRNECPDFEIPNFEPEPNIAITPKSISEARTRLQLRQQSVPTATRQIRFVGDSSGVSQPSKLTFSAKGLTWLGNSAIIGNQLNKQRLTKLQARTGVIRSRSDGNLLLVNFYDVNFWKCCNYCHDSKLYILVVVL